MGAIARSPSLKEVARYKRVLVGAGNRVEIGQDCSRVGYNTADALLLVILKASARDPTFVLPFGQIFRVRSHFG